MLTIDVTVLTATAGLPDELAFAVGRLGDRFAISDLRRAGVGFDLEFADHAVANDFQVQLTHARDDQSGRFPRSVKQRKVGSSSARRCRAFAHLLLVALGLRLDGHADDRLGERRRFEQDRRNLRRRACHRW